MECKEPLPESGKFQCEYAEEKFVLDCLENVCEWMERKEVNRAELAKRLGTSQAKVTRMLRGRNLNVRTVVLIDNTLWNGVR